MAQVGQLDLGAQVEPLDRPGVAQVERERAAVDVVALKRGVREGGDLGDERVGPHEAVERVAELQALLVVQLLEACLGRPEGRVGLGRALLIGCAGAEQRGHRRLDLLGSQHVEVVEATPGVPEDVRVGGRRDRAAVELLERLDDVLGVVAEVEHERALLQRVDAVEARERLHRGQPDQRLVDVHRVQQRLVEAGLELLGDDQHAVLGRRELLGRAALGKAVHVGLGERLPVPSSILPENATSVLMSV